MAGESEGGSNGVSNGAPKGESLTYDQQLARDRAAFLAGDDDAGDENDGGTDDALAAAAAKKSKAKDKAKPSSKKSELEDEDDAEDQVEDDDSDLEDDEDAETSEDEEEEEEESEDADEDEDDDSDLDEDDDDDEDTSEKKLDPATAKRLEQVRRTDRHLRQQREAQFAQREAQLNAREAELKPRLESLEKFERLKERAAIDPAAVFEALGVPQDRFAHAAQVLYTISKAKDDPKAREAAAQLMQNRELADTVAKLSKRLEDRDMTDKQREEQAAQEREVDAYLAKVSKAASDKTPLAREYLKKNPERARRDLRAIASRLVDELGDVPDAKVVMKEFEKERRRILRDHGIDPKALHKTGTLKPDPKKAKALKAKSGDKEPDKKLTFEEQRARDREAFLNDEFD